MSIYARIEEISIDEWRKLSEKRSTPSQRAREIEELARAMIERAAAKKPEDRGDQS